MIILVKASWVPLLKSVYMYKTKPRPMWSGSMKLYKICILRTFCGILKSGPADYLFLNSAGLFSRNAVIPSILSSDAKGATKPSTSSAEAALMSRL